MTKIAFYSVLLIISANFQLAVAQTNSRPEPEVEVAIKDAEQFDLTKEVQAAGNLVGRIKIGEQDYSVYEKDQNRVLLGRTQDNENIKIDKKGVYFFTKLRERLSEQKVFELGFGMSVVHMLDAAYPVGMFQENRNDFGIDFELGIRPPFYRHLKGTLGINTEPASPRGFLVGSLRDNSPLGKYAYPNSGPFYAGLEHDAFIWGRPTQEYVRAFSLGVFASKTLMEYQELVPGFNANGKAISKRLSEVSLPSLNTTGGFLRLRLVDTDGFGWSFKVQKSRGKKSWGASFSRTLPLGKK